MTKMPKIIKNIFDGFFAAKNKKSLIFSGFFWPSKISLIFSIYFLIVECR
jgi:hypothetical protein